MRLPLSLVLPVAWVLLLALPGATAPQAGDQPALAGTALGAPAAPAQIDRPAPGRLSPSNASYTLSAALDAANHQITGEGTLVWRNISTAPTSELRFHLYWNAWRDRHSTWMREATLAGITDMAAWPDRDRGSIDLTRLRVDRQLGSSGALLPAGVQDLLPRLRFVAPDDGNAADRTVVSVALDRPVLPGETVEIALGWTAHVPRTHARTGVIGDYYFIAQWFPKIGVLENTGWNAHQFHLTTEFFADFGTYDVKLTVPAGWTLGATGREQARIDNGDRTATHHYRATDVHDFAWSSSPDFVEVRKRFEPPGLAPVDLRLLLQREHRRQADRHVAALGLALERFSQWFGPYPYDHLTLIDPVTIVDTSVQGFDSGGMEYPTLITGWTNWTAPRRHVDPEDVILHETGHQFWHTVAAPNEFEHAWIDEGLTTYTASRLMADAYPGRFVTVERYFGGLVVWPYDDAPLTRSVRDGADRYRRAPNGDVTATPSWQYDASTGRIVTYFRTTLWLHTLERMLGWSTMQRVLQSFYGRSMFGHPTPDDFFHTANEISGVDLGWFFDAVYRQAGTFDYGVGDVTTVETESGAFDNRVVVRRLGSGVFPIDVHVTFTDGASVTERWSGREPWRAFQYRRASRVAAVAVDPDHVLRLDVHQTNNSWSAAPQAAEAARKWTLRWFTWFQHQLLTYAFFI